MQPTTLLDVSYDILKYFVNFNVWERSWSFMLENITKNNFDTSSGEFLSGKFYANQSIT